MLCPECGTEIPDISKYCLECGCFLGASGTGEGLHLDASREGDSDGWAALHPPSAEGDLVFDPLTRKGSKGSHSKEAIEARRVLKRLEPLDGPGISDPYAGTGVGDRESHFDDATGENVGDDDAPVSGDAGIDDGGYGAADAFGGRWDESSRDSDYERAATLAERRALGPEVVPAELTLATTRKNSMGKAPFVAGAVVVALVALFVGIGIHSTVNAPYKIDAEMFPDVGLRTAILELDEDGDGKLTRKQAAAVTELQIDGAEDVSGLYIFTNLQSLTCTGSQLETVDVTDVPSLVSITVSNSGVSELAISGLENLVSVDASGTDIDSLDLTGLVSLESIDLTDTAVGGIDVSSCAALTSIEVEDSVVVSGLEGTPLEECWTLVSYSGEWSVNYSSEYSSLSVDYDDYGRISVVDYDDSGTRGVYEYFYDEETGLLAQVVQTLDDGDDGDVFEFEYDESGQLVSCSNSTTGESYSYSYDDDGLLAGYVAVSVSYYGYSSEYSREFSYDESGALVAISGDDAVTVEYDSAGRMVSYSTDDGSYSYTFEYDGNGNVIQAEISLGSYGSCIETFEYDSEGNLIGATRTDGSDARWSLPLEEVTDTDFAYDVHGNLIAISMVNEDEEVGLVEISYERTFVETGSGFYGTAPVLSDPLWYCDPQSLFWSPWALEEQDEYSQTALLLAFDPDSTWLGGSNPLDVLAGLVESVAADEDVEADGGDVDGTSEDAVSADGESGTADEDADSNGDGSDDADGADGAETDADDEADAGIGDSGV